MRIPSSHFTLLFNQVLQEKTATTTSTTARVTSVRTGARVSTESTPTTASANQSSQVCKATIQSDQSHSYHESCRVIPLAPPPTGQLCTDDVDECQLMPNACQNGGTCHNTYGSYQCVCVNGWTGDDCSENIDDCASAACHTESTCHDRVASFYCECPLGRTGVYTVLII